LGFIDLISGHQLFRFLGVPSLRLREIGSQNEFSKVVVSKGNKGGVFTMEGAETSALLKTVTKFMKCSYLKTLNSSQVVIVLRWGSARKPQRIVALIVDSEGTGW
jgi:hypothetical protein